MTVQFFRMFGNGTSDLQSCSDSTARALARPSEFDGDYYASRGGLSFAAELCVVEGVPTFIEYDGFRATPEQARLAIEVAQEVL